MDMQTNGPMSPIPNNESGMISYSNENGKFLITIW